MAQPTPQRNSTGKKPQPKAPPVKGKGKAAASENKKEELKTRILLPRFRMSYPALFKPKLNELADEPEYNFQCDALFPKDETDMTPVYAAYEAAIIKEWGSVDEAPTDSKIWKNPIKDGDEHANPAYHGHWYITLKAKEEYKPEVVLRYKGKDGKFVAATEKDIYAGCWAHAMANAYSFNSKANKGVAFGLGNVQKLEDGERLDGGGVSSEEAFADFEQEYDAEEFEIDDGHDTSSDNDNSDDDESEETDW